MSDANKQSVERCEYRHEWTVVAKCDCLNCAVCEGTRAICGECGMCVNCHEHKQGCDGCSHEKEILCSVCRFRPKADSKLMEQAKAILKLRELLQPGSTIRTILRHVSRSGMNRRVSLAIAIDGDVKDISWLAARAMGDPVKNRAGYVQDVGIEVGGCGMDVGFELVYNLGRVLWSHGFVCVGQKCQSNDHSNGVNRRDTFEGQMHTGDGGYALRHEWL